MKKTLSTILLLALLATPAAASYKDIDLDTQFSADELAPYDILQAADGQIRWLLKRNFQSIGTEATNHFVTIKVAQTATNSAFITATSAYGSTDGICVMDLTPAQTDTNGVFWYTAFWKDAAGKQYYSGTGVFTIVESTAAGGGTADPMTTPVNLSARSFTGASGDIATSNSAMIVTGIWGRAISPDAPADGQAYTWDATGSNWVVSTIPTDHGGLTGLTDDDHPQYVETNEGDVMIFDMADGQIQRAASPSTIYIDVLGAAFHGEWGFANLLNASGGLDVTGNLQALTDPTTGNHVGDRGYNDARYLLEANNLSDLDNAGTARSNLGVAIGSDVQAYDADIITDNNGNSLTNLTIPAPVQHDAYTLTSAATVTVSEAWTTNVFVLDLDQDVLLAISDVDTNKSAESILHFRANSHQLLLTGPTVTNLTNADNFSRSNSYQSVVLNRPIYESVTEVW